MRLFLIFLILLFSQTVYCDDKPDAIVNVTAYCLRKNPTSSGHKVRYGIIALSRDLEKRLDAEFGDLIYLEDLGIFVFRDRMRKDIKNTVDIWLPGYKKAKKFGKKKKVLLEMVNK